MVQNPFYYKTRTLYCENMPVRTLVKKYGTPLYIYSRQAFLQRYAEVAGGLKEFNPLICFSVKSNANIAILKMLGRAGAGADIVSGGELFRCLKAGIPPSRIVYAGVGKTTAEIRFALKSGIRLFNVESLPELHAINAVARGMGTIARIGFRLNPDVDAKTHALTTTGKKENKFGLPIAHALDYYREAGRLAHVRAVGIDMHLGSPIFSLQPYTTALRKLLAVLDTLATHNITLEELDIGGGLGITYANEKPFTVAAFARAIRPFVRRSGLRLIVEPGRYICGNSGILATSVTYVKKTPVKNFIITDSGMNDLIRPPLYGSYHRIEPVQKRGQRTMTADIVGPICESSDFMGKDRKIEEPGAGDCLAVMSAGAYGFSMSSNYNSRPRACEVLVSVNNASVIRRRETYDDLVRAEVR
ncbi:MAG: diaminopimelate decarboxylase [Candidatus Raymondbacteria bacterium RifOxyA12_full_50_37]|nr:MAG: diaminopimelate decarboxylase [Candidatus Raymondbacteria bacterium RifOxyA12_full_50_37]OGJ93046.1 MAG: diaminopimelate decarboxylase [Candidatus Raymondbacteria bacterium RIFOXYA2_FULL_49_16]OGJ94878.1 MAG: diaminopimelate decarboxylase [Candidatus Raymondbacteria bacterium RifOxyB12_full_50_8]OGK04150.1 MAG: diaminopimelate decarboxylase [Candidatus Raymondbacteria bacterium RifOxyC12_full_50_8]OGP40841.1 MAG: diaminopimelate decarboxylase [Candidatus Raymondbacteria bacterium RIFOXY